MTDTELRRQVLDHGFIELRNLAGPTRREHAQFDADDIDPAQSARMSFNAMGTERPREDDIRLAGYLLKNWHTTPFEMIECWFEMKLPIFVARQFVRHRTVSINEISGRYVTLPAEWYVPENPGGKPVNAKQGQSDDLPEEVKNNFRWRLDEQCKKSYELYEAALECGVAPEEARLFLHLNHYTHWLWKQDLHNLMHWMSLRADSHAQKQAQIYAVAAYEILKQFLPESMALFDKYRRLR